MLALLYFAFSPAQKIKKKPLLVKTFNAAPRIQEKIAVSVSQPPQKKASVKPVVQKQEVKKAISKKVNKTTAAKPLKPKVSHLLQELEETIAKIDEKRDKDMPVKQLETPKWIKSLKIDTIAEMENDSEAGDNTYQDALIRCLKESLDLPEIGQVKMEVTIDEHGTVMKLRILSSESDKNKHYLEKNLQLIKFPSFKTKKTFTFTFCNDL